MSEVNEEEFYISEQFIVLRGVKCAITFANAKKIFEKFDSTPVSVPLAGYRPAVPWGEDNKLPMQIIDKINKNEIVSANLAFNIQLTYGDGPAYGFVEIDADGNPKFIRKQVDEIDEFFEMSNMRNYYIKQCTDMRTFFAAVPEIMMSNPDDKGVRKAVSIISKQMCFSRWEEPNPKTGEIENMFYSAKWGEGMSEDEVEAIPVLDESDPIRDALIRTGKLGNADGVVEDLGESSFIVPLMMPTPGRLIYPRPWWWSIFQSGWYDVSSSIAELKKWLIENMVTVKYHIQLTQEYFNEIFKREGLALEKDKKARFLKELEDINAFLSKTKNAGKSILSFISYDHQGNEIAQLKITPVENNFKGGEYTEDSEEASNMICYAMEVHPQINGAVPGKGGNISGSEARELFTLKQAGLQAIRHELLKPLYCAKAINGWDKKIQFALPNMVLTTLDKNKTGSETKITV